MVAGWPKIFFIHKHVYLLTNSTHNIRFRNFCEATNELNDQSEIKYKKICEWKKNSVSSICLHTYLMLLYISKLYYVKQTIFAGFPLLFFFSFGARISMYVWVCNSVYFLRMSLFILGFFSLQVLFCVQIKARKKLPTHRSCCESIMCEIVRMHPDASYLTVVMMLIFSILLPIILVKKLKTHIFNVTYMICNED